MLVVTLKVAMSEKLNYKFVLTITQVLVNISKTKSKRELVTVKFEISTGVLVLKLVNVLQRS